MHGKIKILLVFLVCFPVAPTELFIGLGTGNDLFEMVR